jgi:hypothetical protein
MKDHIETNPVFEIVGPSTLGLVAFRVVVMFLLVLNLFCFNIYWVPILGVKLYTYILYRDPIA